MVTIEWEKKIPEDASIEASDEVGSRSSGSSECF
jgi:hypothetical protein